MKHKLIESEFYGRVIAKGLDIIERNDIGIIHKYNIPGNEWIKDTYMKVKINVKRYISELLSDGKQGYFAQSVGSETLYSYVYFTMLAGLLDIKLDGSVKI